MANSDNPRRGAEFERLVREFFLGRGLSLEPNYEIAVCMGRARRSHKFDLGSHNPPVLLECKSHSWTEGGNAPSAKLTVWNEAMLYFAAAPSEYRKILVVKHALRGSESLSSHYVRRFAHLVPRDVEIWEFDPATNRGQIVFDRAANETHDNQGPSRSDNRDGTRE